MTAVYRLERTGDGPEIHEVLLTRSCPECGADWTVDGAVKPRPGVNRSFWCTAPACGRILPAREVNADGQPVTPRSWSSPRQHRQQHDEGPAATHEG